MSDQEALETLNQRRQYLTLRIDAKKRMGWEFLYDQRERDALTWALDILLTQVMKKP